MENQKIFKAFDLGDHPVEVEITRRVAGVVHFKAITPGAMRTGNLNMRNHPHDTTLAGFQRAIDDHALAIAKEAAGRAQSDTFTAQAFKWKGSK